MSNFEQWAHDAIKHAKGMIGESSIRAYLIKKKIHHAQVDLICKVRGRWLLLEIKNQERFKAPPFDGHGLPVWQFEARLQFYDETGIQPWLFVVEPDDLTTAYCASMAQLRELDESCKFISKNRTRIIFRMSAFTEIDLTGKKPKPDTMQ
jgi:hypothetical protein